MSQKVWPAMLLVTLVVTPATMARAQTNPWYIPPQPSYQPQTVIQGYATTQTGALPQTSPYSTQLGLGAGYSGQYGSAATAAPVQGIQQWGTQQQGYGSVQANPSISSGTASQPIYQQQLGYQQQQPNYQQQLGYQQQPNYQQQPVYQQQPIYQQQQQPAYQLPPLGNYPPLGSDPTELTTSKRSAPQRAGTQSPAAGRAEADPAAPRTSTPYAIDHPGFAGPTTLSPGYGGLGGYQPLYPAPVGAAPYLGLPFF